MWKPASCERLCKKLQAAAPALSKAVGAQSDPRAALANELKYRAAIGRLQLTPQGSVTRLTRLKECHKMSPDIINPRGAWSWAGERCQGGKRAPRLLETQSCRVWISQGWWKTAHQSKGNSRESAPEANVGASPNHMQPSKDNGPKLPLTSLGSLRIW